MWPGKGQQARTRANLSAAPQTVAANVIRRQGLSYSFGDLVTDAPVSATSDLTLEPYEFVWLTAE